MDYYSNFQYVCSIRENGQWTYYSEDSIQQCGYEKESLYIGIPSCAIYKKIINN